MFKTIIAPVQAWLLSKGQCVGCGMPLHRLEHQSRKDGTRKVVCKCGRIFIHDLKQATYRRALFKEL